MFWLVIKESPEDFEGSRFTEDLVVISIKVSIVIKLTVPTKEPSIIAVILESIVFE